MPMNVFFFYTAFPSIAHCSSLAMPTTKPDPERLAILKAHSTFGTCVCVCVCIARPCACVCVCMCPCLVACTYNAYARSSTRRDCKMTTGTKGLWNLGSRKVMRLGSWRRCWKMERRLNGLLHFCSHIPPWSLVYQGFICWRCLQSSLPFWISRKEAWTKTWISWLVCLIPLTGKKHHNQSDSNKANLPVMKSMMLTDLIILIYFSWIFSSGVPFGVYILHLLLPDPAAYQRSICTGVATVICYQFSNRERDKGPNIKPELPFQIYQKNSPFLHRRHWRGWPWSGNLLNKKTLRLGMVGSLALFRGPHFALQHVWSTKWALIVYWRRSGPLKRATCTECLLPRSSNFTGGLQEAGHPTQVIFGLVATQWF